MRIISTSNSEIHLVLDTMDIGLDDFSHAAAGEQARIRELEARIKWLEGALTSVLQSRRARAASGEAALLDALGGTQRLTPLPFSAEFAAAEAKDEPADPMRFTSAFATLDARLLEQAEMESAPLLREEDLAPPVMIDAGLIDRAFARPAPELIDVRCGLEEGYPHLMERIAATWRSPESVLYLRKLIVDERGDRQGFPFEVMSELLTLSSMLEAPQDRDEWGIVQVH